jgi:hypothetical protein
MRFCLSAPLAGQLGRWMEGESLCEAVSDEGGMGCVPIGSVGYVGVGYGFGWRRSVCVYKC